MLIIPIKLCTLNNHSTKLNTDFFFIKWWSTLGRFSHNLTSFDYNALHSYYNVDFISPCIRHAFSVQPISMFAYYFRLQCQWYSLLRSRNQILRSQILILEQNPLYQNRQFLIFLVKWINCIFRFCQICVPWKIIANNLLTYLALFSSISSFLDSSLCSRCMQQPRTCCHIPLRWTASRVFFFFGIWHSSYHFSSNLMNVVCFSSFRCFNLVKFHFDRLNFLWISFHYSLLHTLHVFQFIAWILFADRSFSLFSFACSSLHFYYTFVVVGQSYVSSLLLFRIFGSAIFVSHSLHPNFQSHRI